MGKGARTRVNSAEKFKERREQAKLEIQKQKKNKLVMTVVAIVLAVVIAASALTYVFYYQNGEYLKTAFTVAESGNKVTFSIKKAEGDVSVVPEERTYTVKFKDIVSGNVTVNGADAVVNTCGTLEVKFTAKAEATVEITLENCDYLRNGEMKPMLTNVISKFQMSTDKKGMVYNSFIQNKKSVPNVAKDFRGPIEEIMNLYR